MTDDPFTHVYDTRTGLLYEHRVPRNWVGHPVLGAHFSLTPPAKSGGKKNTNPPAAGDTPKED